MSSKPANSVATNSRSKNRVSTTSLSLARRNSSVSGSEYATPSIAGRLPESAVISSIANSRIRSSRWASFAPIWGRSSGAFSTILSSVTR